MFVFKMVPVRKTIQQTFEQIAQFLKTLVLLVEGNTEP